MGENDRVIYRVILSVMIDAMRIIDLSWMCDGLFRFE